jgi:hypothetical protein
MAAITAKSSVANVTAVWHENYNACDQVQSNSKIRVAHIWVGIRVV